VYGGQLSHSVVRERIVRAFLIEEQKIVKRVRFFVACSFLPAAWPPPPRPARPPASRPPRTLKKQLLPHAGSS
jgi:hypothetical protein